MLSTVELMYRVAVPWTVGSVIVTTFVLVATVETVDLSNDEQYCDAWASRTILPPNAEDWTEQKGNDEVTEGCKDDVALLDEVC